MLADFHSLQWQTTLLYNSSKKQKFNLQQHVLLSAHCLICKCTTIHINCNSFFQDATGRQGIEKEFLNSLCNQFYHINHMLLNLVNFNGTQKIWYLLKQKIKINICLTFQKNCCSCVSLKEVFFYLYRIQFLIVQT